MHNGAVAARARNGVERQIASDSRWRGDSLPGFRPPAISVSSPPARIAFEPATETAPAPRRRGYAPCACLRFPALFLQALGSWQGSALALDFRAGLGQPVEDGRRGGGGIGQHAFVLQRIQRARELRPARAACTALPRCAISSGVRLAASRNRSAPPSSCRMAKAKRKGRVRHVAAANVEQPADGIRQGDHRRIRAGFLQPFGQAQCAWPGSVRPPD